MMLRYIVVRLFQVIPTVIGVTILAFAVLQFTGDPAVVMLPIDAPEEAFEEFRREHGLDASLFKQYLLFLGKLVQGDLGTSIRYGLPVTELVGNRLPSTLQLTAASMGLAVLIGLPLGMLSGLFRGSWIDTISRGFSFIAQAVPTFYLGLILIIIFGVSLELLPTIGNQGVSSLILPSITLGAYMAPLILRVSRGAILDVAGQDYIRTARAKGVPYWRIVRMHMIKNSMIPVVTIVGLQLGSALSGAIVTETVFSWPGVGRMLIESIAARDFPVVLGVVLLAALAFVFVNLIVDLTYAFLDPRIRMQ